MAVGVPPTSHPSLIRLTAPGLLHALHPWSLALGAGGQVLILLATLGLWGQRLPGGAGAGLMLLATALALIALPHRLRLTRRAEHDGGAPVAAAQRLQPLAPILGRLVIACHVWGRGALAALALTVLQQAMSMPPFAGLPGYLVPGLLLCAFLPGQETLAACGSAALLVLGLASAGVLLAHGAPLPLLNPLADAGGSAADPFTRVSNACAALFLLGPSVSAFDSVLALPRGSRRRAGAALPLAWCAAGATVLAIVAVSTNDHALLEPVLRPGGIDRLAGGGLMIAAAGLALMLAWTDGLQTLRGGGALGLLPMGAGGDWPLRLLLTGSIALFYLLREIPGLYAGAALAYFIGQAGIAAVVLLPGRHPEAPAGRASQRMRAGAAPMLAAAAWLGCAILGLQTWGVQAVLIGLMLVYAGALMLSPFGLSRAMRGSVHSKLLAGMLLVLALNGAGYLVADQALTSQDHPVAILVGDIFTAVALLTVLVGLVLPAMIVHTLTQAAESAERLAHEAVSGLREGIDALGRGELDLAPIPLCNRRLETPFRDEIGRIAVSINALQDDVQLAARGLESARENLRRSRAELFHQARHDSLTGLHNRRAFEEELAQVVADRRHAGIGHALLYLDLDQFKIVNDTCGHDAGDELLRQVSLLLSGQMRADDILSRLGGDEFGVILADCSSENALRIAEGMLVAVRELSFGWQDRVFRIGVSIGVVHFLSGSTTLTEVLSAADKACYYAKEQGRNRLHAYSPDDDEITTRSGEMQWVSRIHEALEQGRMCLYAQYIRPLNPPASEGDAGHHELLLRMVDLQGELVPPMAFIPAAERFGVMTLLDRWVVRTALARLAELQASGERIDVDSLAINLSGASITDESFLEYVKEQFRLSRVPHHQVWFEITETSAIANLKKAKRFIAELRALGCRFGLDDFGAGMSSFGYLRQLDVDFLKIDGAFVQDMADDPIDHAMVASINRIGQLMGLRTIAEFVEDERAIAMLRDLGVNMVQGNGVSAPIPFVRLPRNAGSVPATADHSAD